jgi:transcriptional regulator with XRE-family HTH domain
MVLHSNFTTPPGGVKALPKPLDHTQRSNMDRMRVRFMLIAIGQSHGCVAILSFRASSCQTQAIAVPQADHIRTRRLDLKLLQRQVANQIGVHEMTITGWESNATVPEVRYMPAIIQFLGYNPLPAASSLPERLATARRALGLSQRKMAAKLGVDPATLMGWEAGRHQPSPKKLALITNLLG